MKILLNLILLLLIGCQEKYQISPGNSMNSRPVVQSSSISSGRIVLAGQNLSNIKMVASSSANLAGYKMEIESLSSNTATIKLTHTSSSVLNLAFGTILTFIISTAEADTTINLTVDVAPTGAVMAFNLASCPAGWSAMDGTGGRPDARGRTIVGSGTGTGLTNRALASVGGAETHTLTVPQMPAHTHTATMRVLGDPGSTGSPTSNYLAAPIPQMFESNWDTTLAADSIEVGVQGTGAAHPIMQPYVALLYCQKN
jgi:hypothetical protein